MPSGTLDWQIRFYVNARGDSPPLQYIKGFSPKNRAKVARSIDLLRHVGVAIREPYAKHLDGKLWELRLSPHRLIYFAIKGRRVVILHGFTKQRHRMLRHEIEVARTHMQRTRRDPEQ